MTTPSAAPALKSSVVAEIEELGFTWHEEAEFDLTRLSVERRVQVREAEHYAPKEFVQRFRVQMGQTSFPPIVVTADDWIIDGNTRVGARSERKEKFSPALIIEVAYGSATSKQKAVLAALAATLNQMNGNPLTSREMRSAVIGFIDLAWTEEQIARRLGLKNSDIVQVKKERAAEAKLRKVGLSPNGNLRPPTLRALGAKDVVNLNDVPFKELASLATDAGLKASEINSTAKEIKAAGSDEAALALLEKLREEQKDAIQALKLTGTPSSLMSRQLRQHLGFITKFSGREQELIETNPSVNQTHIEALEGAIVVLTEVLKMQKG